MSHQRVNMTNIAMIGCGTIGISWTAYFLSRGLHVTAFDPDANARAQFTQRVAEDMRALGAEARTPVVAQTLAEALEGVELVVENAPESVSLKQQLLVDIQQAAPSQALVVSSTSSLKHSDITKGAPAPERIIIAHPFNPPHLVPLVELYGPETELVERLVDFYRRIGKQPVMLRKEMIGHIANRLSSALWREALYLLQAGPGLRWAIQGPFLTYHLGGGQGGIRHYLEHLGPSQEYRWASLGQPTMNDELYAQVIHGVESATQGQSLPDLFSERDRQLTAIQQALAINVKQEETL